MYVDKNEDLMKEFRNNTFKLNNASNSGGAIKLLFDYSLLNESSEEPSTFFNNNDYNGLNICDGKPTYFRFSFYDVLVVKTPQPNEDYSKWVEDPTMTVILCQFSESKDFSGSLLVSTHQIFRPISG